MDFGDLRVCLCVSDIEASAAFYRRLGFEVVEDVKGGRKLLRLAGVLLSLHRQSNNPGSPPISLQFTPSDIRRVSRELIGKGIDADLEGPNANEATGTAWFTLRDPDGTLLLFEQFAA